MHFILLVYKYEYIMNKSSYFIDLADIFFILQCERTNSVLNYHHLLALCFLDCVNELLFRGKHLPLRYCKI